MRNKENYHQVLPLIWSSVYLCSEPVKDDEASNQTSAATEAVAKEKFDLNGDEFPDLSISKVLLYLDSCFVSK